MNIEYFLLHRFNESCASREVYGLKITLLINLFHITDKFKTTLSSNIKVIDNRNSIFLFITYVFDKKNIL